MSTRPPLPPFTGMKNAARIALVGDYDPAVTAHQAIPPALRLAAQHLGVEVGAEWVHTATLGVARGGAEESLRGYTAVWCVPASPYASEAGALAAIRHARESGLPFLGTCGGFQHAVLEYIRNVLGHARVVARDPAGEVRAVELSGHPFFVATLFQPERSGLRGVDHPLINAFVAAACGRGTGSASRRAGSTH